MNPSRMLAEIDLGTLLYIIIVFFWVIGNMLSAKKRKQRRGGMPIPRAGESDAERELREFLEGLSGKPAEPEIEPEPAAAPPPPPRPVRRRERPRPAVMIYEPSLPSGRMMAPNAMAAPETASPALSIDEIAREMRDAAPSMAGSFSTTLSSMASLFKTSGLTMPALRYALSSSRPAPARPVLGDKLLTNRNDLRRLIAGRIVLGPPRALDPYQADTEATRSV